MSIIQFVLGPPVPLYTMVPAGAGPAALPQGIPAQGGIYLILNGQVQPSNNHTRYMGCTQNLATRFGLRQQVCFEMGFRQNQLQQIYAFCGGFVVTNTPQQGQLQPNVRNYALGNALYGMNNTNVQVDGVDVDYEHLFIKAAQVIFGGYITNTQKVGAFTNTTGNPMNVSISWQGLQGSGINTGQLALPITGILAANAQLV